MARTKKDPISKRIGAVARKQLRVSEVKRKVVEVKPRKPHKYKPGTVALRNIRRLQKSTKLCLPKVVVRRIVRDILSESPLPSTGSTGTWRIKAASLGIIHEAIENKVIELLRLSNLLTIKNGKQTVKMNDVICADEILEKRY